MKRFGLKKDNPMNKRSDKDLSDPNLFLVDKMGNFFQKADGFNIKEILSLSEHLRKIFSKYIFKQLLTYKLRIIEVL